MDNSPALDHPQLPQLNFLNAPMRQNLQLQDVQNTRLPYDRRPAFRHHLHHPSRGNTPLPSYRLDLPYAVPSIALSATLYSTAERAEYPPAVQLEMERLGARICVGTAAEREKRCFRRVERR